MYRPSRRLLAGRIDRHNIAEKLRKVCEVSIEFEYLARRTLDPHCSFGLSVSKKRVGQQVHAASVAHGTSGPRPALASAQVDDLLVSAIRWSTHGSRWKRMLTQARLARIDCGQACSPGKRRSRYAAIARKKSLPHRPTCPRVDHRPLTISGGAAVRDCLAWTPSTWRNWR